MLNVAAIIYEGVELVDLHGPLDVFLHANAEAEKPDLYRIYTVAESTEPVLSEGGIVTIVPGFDFTSCPVPDILIVPGLLDQALIPTTANQACISFIKRIMEQDKIILSVCVGLYNVAATGLLAGKRVTTHYAAIESFQRNHPNIRVIKNVRTVRDGNLVSTGGITSGIDGALDLLEDLDGIKLAQAVADVMVYNRKAPLPPSTLLRKESAG